MRTPLIASLACLALGACATDQGASTLAESHPITPTERYAIQVKPSPVELMLAAHGSGLSPAQVDALRNFMGRYNDADRGAITIKAPEHGPDQTGVYRTASSTRDFLIAQGVSPGDVQIVGYDAGGDAKAPVRVAFVSYLAQGPVCGTSWSDVTKTENNEPYPEFGCAVTANVAAELADPADLMHPRASDPPDAQRRATVLDKYRQGRATSTPADPRRMAPSPLWGSDDMTPQAAPAADPFDLDFDGEGEFSTPHTSETPEAHDPFAGLSSSPLPADEEEVGAPATGNPIAEMLASAEAALGEHTVPRITIHFHWSRAETGELIHRASGDRRMERAKIVTQEGGLGGAVDFYQNQPTPSLLVVETLDPTPKLIQYLEKLSEVCDPGTKVIVIGAANDIALYRELMRRGVSEYLVPPLGTLQLIAAITALYADPAQPFIGRQIAFCGAKGGAGSSTLAHNVAHLISERMGADTVLVDLDLAFGTAGLDFNQDPLHGIADALSQPDRLDSVLMERMMARCGDHLSLFAAPASLERDFDISPETFEEVAHKIRASTPYVVLDLPHAWTPWKRRMLTTSDDVVVVAEPDLASLRNAKNIVDLVRAARPNDAPPRVVLNKVGVPGRPEIPQKDFGEALGLTPCMSIMFDAKLFGQAANNGQMLGEVGPKSKQAESLDILARMISRRETGEAPAPKAASLMDRLLKR